MNHQILKNTKTDLELSKEYENYEPKFIIEGLVKKNGKNIFCAERGSGKTRLLLWIAYSIVFEQTKVLGYNIKEFGDVLFVNMEIEEKEFKAFADPIRNYFKNHLHLTQKHQLYITSFRAAKCAIGDIKLVVAEHNPVLTIIDSYKIYQAIICNEKSIREINNSNFDVVLDPLDELISDFKTTIVLINHTNKGTRKLESTSDIMFGPGALPDFVDHVTLLRKAITPNQRIIVPDKARYSGEGFVTTNLVEIKSSDLSSSYPDFLNFELIEEDVNETDYLPINLTTHIDPKVKKEIIKFIESKKGTMADAAEKYLGKASLKGSVSKIMKKYNEGK